ncbi:hypothetical protein [Weissella confusa]|uniref:hypothetical protein n=1 Tax=Weissella confusa TaxID=1583 RepID=UPI0013E00800|nr:hypothetical protein [Weissella confusa]QIE79434.1 hypothetical protein G4V46_09545 [Weissella confusa]
MKKRSAILCFVTFMAMNLATQGAANADAVRPVVAQSSLIEKFDEMIQGVKDKFSGHTESDHNEPIIESPDGEMKPTQVTDISVSENAKSEPVIVGAVDTPDLENRRWARDVNAGRTEEGVWPVRMAKNHPIVFLLMMLVIGNASAVFVYRVKRRPVTTEI